VPFAAIKSFVDPSVQFGVQFELLVADDGSENASARPPAEHRPASGVTPVPTPANPPPANPPAANPPAAEQTDGSETPSGGGQVVNLDRFRKK